MPRPARWFTTGEVTLKITGDNLNPATVTIKVTPAKSSIADQEFVIVCHYGQTALLKPACLNRSSSSAGMRHRRQTRIAVMLRDAHSARIVFGASLSCAAASSVVRRFDRAGLTVRSGGRDTDFIAR
jgi:hypothetical protein